MRKEQGKKLKELMARKRAEKKKLLENELADLSSLESLKTEKEAFKEELATRGFKTVEAYTKRIKFLNVKLGIEQPEEEEEIDKNRYSLLEIADEFLKPDQLK